MCLGIVINTSEMGGDGAIFVVIMVVSSVSQNVSSLPFLPFSENELGSFWCSPVGSLSELVVEAHLPRIKCTCNAPGESAPNSRDRH